MLPLKSVTLQTINISKYFTLVKVLFVLQRIYSAKCHNTGIAVLSGHFAIKILRKEFNIG